LGLGHSTFVRRYPYSSAGLAVNLAVTGSVGIRQAGIFSIAMPNH
jgi:hypothetical protein